MGTDDYERQYMGGGEAIARSKAGMPWWFHLLIAMACLSVVGTSLLHGATASLAILPVLLLVWILFLFLRVTVTSDTVHVQLGVFGPKIPVADILEVRAEKYSLLKYGGWGIRFALDGSVAYSVPGHGGRGIRIRYRKKSGRESTAWVTTPDPESLIAAIEQARGAKGVRVAEEVRVRSEPSAREVAEPPEPETEEKAHDGRSRRAS
jgi:hypothetical protein